MSGQHPYLVPEPRHPATGLEDLYYEPPIWGSRPSAGELRAASAELQVARLHAELETLLSATWRGRLALRILGRRRWRS